MRIRRALLLPLLTIALLLAVGMAELLSAPPPRPSHPKAHFAPDQILVKFRGTRAHPGQGPAAEQAVQASLSQEARRALAKVGHIKGIVPSLGLLLVQLRPGLSVGEAIEALYRSGTVDYAEPNYRIQLQGLPNDTYFSSQWGLHNVGQSGGTIDADIDAPAAWNIRKSANAVVVAVIDSGVDYNHEDLSSNMWQNPGEIPGNGTDDDGNGKIDDVYGWDFYNGDEDPMDTHGHGTQVAGVIAARGNNGKGITGVAWYGKIMALRCQSSWWGYTWSAAEAIAYALDIKTRHGISRMILNCSWAASDYSQALYDACKQAQSKGVLVVAATPNWTINHDLRPTYPACFDLDNIISVGPSDRYDDRPSETGYGSASVDLHAPGVEIWSTSPGDSYGMSAYSSSLAAAHVSGAAALVWSHRYDQGYRVIKGLILNGAESGQVAGAFKGRSVTEGRLNLANSLKDDLLDDPAIFSVSPNQAWIGDTITIKGVNFGKTSGTLRFAGVDFPGSIVSWGNSEIEATIPAGLPKQTGRLQVITPAGTSRGACFAHGWVESLVGHVLIPRFYAASAQVSGAVWILGGNTPWGTTGIVEKYDLAGNYSTIDSRWTMPTPVSCAGAAAIGSKIYVVGGTDAQGNFVKTLQIFDTQTRTWSTGKDAPNTFNAPAVVSYGGRLYVFGGAGGGMSDVAYSYDPGSDTWAQLADMPQATRDAAAAPIGTGGQILVMGGGWAGGEMAVTQIYDVAGDTWSLGPNLKKARAGAAGINYGNQVFCLHGSGYGENPLSDSEYYASGTWRNTIFGPQRLYRPLAGRSGKQIFILGGMDDSQDYSLNVWRFTIP